MIGLIVGIYFAVGSIIIVPGDIVNQNSRMTTFENSAITSLRVVTWPVVVFCKGVKPWNNKSKRIEKR